MKSRIHLRHIKAWTTAVPAALVLLFASSRKQQNFLKMSDWRNRFVLGLLVGFIGVVVSLTPLGSELEENVGLSWLFQLRGTVSPPAGVVVVAIDKASSLRLGLPNMPSLWPRNLHARLIENLSKAGAQVIAFDLRFDTPGNVPENDTELAEAMKNAGNVVIVERLDQEELFTDEVSGAYSGGSIQKPALPLPIIAEAAVAHTAFPLPRTSRVNDYWVFRNSAGDSPTLPAVVLQLVALHAYDDFIRLLSKTSTSQAAQLPIDKKATEVEDLILTLRGIFMNEPGIAQHMLMELNRDSNIDQRNKKIIRSLISLYAGTEMRYLNFYGPPRTVHTVPYNEALQVSEGSTPTSAATDFKDKVVFVGFSAATQPEQDRIRDDYHTVFSRPDGLYISGVEIAATAFANLLEDRSIQQLTSGSSLVMIFLWGFAIALGYATVSHRSLTTLAGGLICLSISLALIYIFVAYYQFKHAGIWLPIIVPLLIQVPIALAGTLSLKYHGSRQEYKALKKAFGKFLPERVVAELTKNADPVSARNQLVYGTCLATDAEMYTALAETMNPVELGVLMNDYYATMFGPVSEHKGIVSDVVGDAMLAIWAASAEDEFLRKKACLASLEIIDAVDRFNKVEGRPRLPTRIGLHSGEMFLGTVGALNHYEYRAVGDMVNTTNRIQGLNKYLGTHLLASAKVVEGLDDFLTRPMGAFLLAGKTASVYIVELMTRKQDASREQIWLCEIFAYAMRLYDLREWPGGCHNFSEILRAFPDDGPAKFYLKRCQDYRQLAPVGPWDASIRIDGK